VKMGEVKQVTMREAWERNWERREGNHEEGVKEGVSEEGVGKRIIQQKLSRIRRLRSSVVIRRDNTARVVGWNNLMLLSILLFNATLLQLFGLRSGVEAFSLNIQHITYKPIPWTYPIPYQQCPCIVANAEGQIELPCLDETTG
jgi:hypothetical protein